MDREGLFQILDMQAEFGLCNYDIFSYAEAHMKIKYNKVNCTITYNKVS